MEEKDKKIDDLETWIVVLGSTLFFSSLFRWGFRKKRRR